MGLFSENVRTMQDLLKRELEDLYDAEIRLVDALPQMAEHAHSPRLKSAFREHLEQTRNHVERLERVFDVMHQKPNRHTCEAMKGLLKEGEETFSMEGDDDVIDAAMIGAAQRVEHYEIAAYGTARSFAERLGMPEAAHILQETLNEEKFTDHRLTEIAEGEINPSAGI